MIYLAVFFSPAIPLSLPITAFGLFLMYWTTKYAMLRYCRYPPHLGLELSYQMTNLLEYAPLLFAISNWFFTKIEGKKTYMAYAYMSLTFIIWLIPA